MQAECEAHKLCNKLEVKVENQLSQKLLKTLFQTAKILDWSKFKALADAGTEIVPERVENIVGKRDNFDNAQHFLFEKDLTI